MCLFCAFACDNVWPCDKTKQFSSLTHTCFAKLDKNQIGIENCKEKKLHFPLPVPVFSFSNRTSNQIKLIDHRSRKQYSTAKGTEGKYAN